MSEKRYKQWSIIRTQPYMPRWILHLGIWEDKGIWVDKKKWKD